MPRLNPYPRDDAPAPARIRQPVAEFPLVQAMLADCKTEIYTAQSMTQQLVIARSLIRNAAR